MIYQNTPFNYIQNRIKDKGHHNVPSQCFIPGLSPSMLRLDATQKKVSARRLRPAPARRREDVFYTIRYDMIRYDTIRYDICRVAG